MCPVNRFPSCEASMREVAVVLALAALLALIAAALGQFQIQIGHVYR